MDEHRPDLDMLHGDQTWGSSITAQGRVESMLSGPGGESKEGGTKELPPKEKRDAS